MRHITLVLILLTTTILIIIGCSKKQTHKDSEPEGPAAAVQTRSYVAIGTVKSINRETPAVEIDHEDIKGLMPAMQMRFHVKDKALLEGLAPEDRVTFTIENGVGGLKIVAIHKM